jgi:predicted ATPase/DNA-binding CsgD family transcriptional regulator
MIAEAFGLTFTGPEPFTVQVRNFLRHRQILLVFDNAEHLPGISTLFADLLLHAAGLKLLVTSRARLRLLGEWVVTLSGLPFPEAASDDQDAAAEFSAVQLFLQRARSQGATITSTNLLIANQICHLVDGLPLAIELAASWARMLAFDEILSELHQGLDFLTDTANSLPERQQGLRMVFDYSWNLLAPAEQVALRRLAVFHGRFTIEAAAAVCGELDLTVFGELGTDNLLRRQTRATLALLARLVDASLVRRVVIGESTRFELLGLVQQYAFEQLDRAGERADAELRHASYYAAWLAARAHALRGAGQTTVLAEMIATLPQIRVAWQRAVATHDHQILRRAASALFHFYDMRSWFHEGMLAFGAARTALLPFQHDPQIATTLGMLTWRVAWFSFQEGQQQEARQLFEESITFLRAQSHSSDLPYALSYCAAVCAYLGDYEANRNLTQAALKLAQASGDRYAQAVISTIIGQAAYDQGDYQAAQHWSQQGLMIEQSTGNRWGMSFSLTNLGKIAYVTEADSEARWFFEESLSTRRSLGDIRGAAISQARLGDVALAAGDPALAQQHYTESLYLFRQIGNRWGEISALTSLSRLALARGQLSFGMTSLQDALRLAIETSAVPQIAALLSLAAPIIGRSSPDLAEAINQTIQTPSNAEDYRSISDRVLAWRSDSARPHSDLTLEQALAALPDPAVWTNSRRTQPAIPPEARHAYPAGLTAREVDVLRLVAQGLTDAEVADRLVVSKRTVNSHLTSIYSKLQVNSRSGATRFAVEHGIV